MHSASTCRRIDRFRDEKFVTYSTRVGLSHDQIDATYEDRSGALWVGTTGGGLNRIKNGVITPFGAGNRFPGPVVSGLGEGRI